MAFIAKTDHQLICGQDVMATIDCNTMAQIVVATRSEGIWTIHADGIDDVTATNRPDAIDAMREHALAKLGPSGANGEGYTRTIPPGARDMP